MNGGAALVMLGAAFGACFAWFAAARRALQGRKSLSAPFHELRGSLAAIQLGLFALERRGASPAIAGRIDALRMQAERAHAAVEDADDIRLARRSARKLELIELGAVVRRRAVAWAGLAEARRRTVELRWPIGKAVVRGEGGRIGQALDNLIVNALDHGSGLVSVTGMLTERTVRIAVADQGPGITRPLAEATRSPWHTRHGHGLAIAVRVAELHGGRLTAASGKIGSRIEMELPLAEPPATVAAAAGPVMPRGPFRLERASDGQA